ncbi:hypothetical protein [Streptomyces canus]|uniref:hypothetical protein n=1 Tax=Streptomyces canus TaxID=58343 RepID=UPI002780D986|nr:hypothetical protein [Streptomyces canus]MDQ0758686.1 hypothetical protein [Streptomyces canus]
MSQQISMEDAFPTFEKKATELFRANMLLQAQLDVQERQLAALREENERLKQGAPETQAGGQDLTAVPPYQPADEQG